MSSITYTYYTLSSQHYEKKVHVMKNNLL